MFKSSVARFTLGSLVACFASVATASTSAESNGNRPEGSWLLEVNFPAQLGNPPLRFKEIMTLHAGGTVTETNSALNAVSGAQGFGVSGSDGQGTWRRTEHGQIQAVFHKMVICGTVVGLCNSFGKSTGELLGYLVVRLTGTVRGDEFVCPLGCSETSLVVGETPTSPVVIPFGIAGASGTRLR